MQIIQVFSPFGDRKLPSKKCTDRTAAFSCTNSKCFHQFIKHSEFPWLASNQCALAPYFPSIISEGFCDAELTRIFFFISSREWCFLAKHNFFFPVISITLKSLPLLLNIIHCGTSCEDFYHFLSIIQFKFAQNVQKCHKSACPQVDKLKWLSFSSLLSINPNYLIHC